MVKLICENGAKTFSGGRTALSTHFCQHQISTYKKPSPHTTHKNQLKVDISTSPGATKHTGKILMTVPLLILQQDKHKQRMLPAVRMKDSSCRRHTHKDKTVWQERQARDSHTSDEHLHPMCKEITLKIKPHRYLCRVLLCEWLTLFQPEKKLSH